MMGFSSLGSGWLWGLQFHMVFMWLILVGTVLLFVWAYKTLSKDDLKKWVAWLLIIGVIGSWLTHGMAWNGWQGMMGGKGFGGNVNWQGMMQSVQQDDTSGLKNQDDWNNYMWGKMKNYMGNWR